jgi:hypothetical protein
MFNKKYFALLLSVLMLMALLCGCGETADVTDTTTADTSVDITTTAPVEEAPKELNIVTDGKAVFIESDREMAPAKDDHGIAALADRGDIFVAEGGDGVMIGEQDRVGGKFNRARPCGDTVELRHQPIASCRDDGGSEKKLEDGKQEKEDRQIPIEPIAAAHRGEYRDHADSAQTDKDPQDQQDHVCRAVELKFLRP